MKIKENNILKLKNVSAGANTKTKKVHIQDINIEIKKGSITSIIGDHAHRQLLGKVIAGETGWYQGELVFKDVSVLPNNFNKLALTQKIVSKKIKFIDSSFVERFEATTTVREALTNALASEETEVESRKWKEVELWKKIFLTIGEELNLKEKKSERIFELSILKEKEFFESRNRKHYKELRKNYSFHFIINYFQTRRGLKVEKDRLYEWLRSSIDNKKSRAVIERYNGQIDDKLDKILEESKIEKERFKKLKKEAKTKEKESLRNARIYRLSFLENRLLMNEDLEEHKKENMFDNYFKDYEFRGLKEIDEDGSLFNLTTAHITNFFKKTHQLHHKIKHKKRWSKFKNFFCFGENINNKLNELIQSFINETSHQFIEKKMNDTFINTLEDTGLEKNYLNLTAKNLTAGELFQVSLSLAIVSNPDILVVQEPYRFLEPTLRGQVMDILLKVQKEKKFTLLFLTSNISVGSGISDSIYILNQTIVEYGDSRNIILKPIHPITRERISWMSVMELETSDYFRKTNSIFIQGREEFVVDSNHHVFGREENFKHWTKDTNDFEMSQLYKYLIREKKEQNLIILN